MSDVLPYGRQSVNDDDIKAVSDVLRSDFLTTGPAVSQFEAALGRQSGAAHAVAVNSGTAALHAAYFAVGVRPKDNVLTTPLTFAATANAALYLGATVTFADISPDTGTIDPASVAKAMTPGTRLVVAVDYAGHPADYGALRAAVAPDVGIVSDAAHSLGASWDGRMVGTLADATTLSFHPVKLITTGEGGAVLTDDADVASRARTFRTHGIVRSDAPDGVEEPWYYEMEELGLNYRLTDIQAALGSSQLRRAAEFVARRRAIADVYHRAFAGLDAIRLPTTRPGVASAWHLYVIRVRAGAEMRRRLFVRLRELGLGVQVHYIPVYWHPYYRRLGYRPGLCPNAEEFYSQAISLPMFPGMTDTDVESVVERVQTACASVL